MYRPRIPLSVSHRFEITRVLASEVFFCINHGVCDDQTLDAVRQNQRLSPVLFTALADRADDPFNPTRGYNARADLEHASSLTLSSFGYNRLYADGAVYKRFGDRRLTGVNAKVLAGHLRLGLVRALGSQMAGTDTGRRILHPRKRFYAGGATSVRGYGEAQLGPRILTAPPEVLARLGCDTASIVGIQRCNPNGAALEGEHVTDADFTPRPLGGTALLEASVEYRFPIMDKLSGAVFIDAGIVAADPEFRTQPGLEDLSRGTGAITPGFGVRYRSPVGPIRIDLGINPSISENLPVVTEIVIDGERRIVRLGDPSDPNGVTALRRYSPSGGQRGVAKLLSRLTLHLSIGQAY
jgi:outer membrane protein assembly factor BamA